jgi:hypothetical protein
MTTPARHIKEVFIVISTILTVVPGVGCTGQFKPADAARATVSDAVSGVAGVVAHTESAQRHVEQAIPHADDTGKVHLAAATDEHKEVVADAAETKQALDATAKEITALEGQVMAVQADYTKLESRWYVRWGRWIERALWIIGISWLVLGAASVVLGMGNPLSLTWRMGKEITRLVPLMNPFSWVRDWILSRRASADAGKAG